MRYLSTRLSPEPQAHEPHLLSTALGFSRSLSRPTSTSPTCPCSLLSAQHPLAQTLNLPNMPSKLIPSLQLLVWVADCPSCLATPLCTGAAPAHTSGPPFEDPPPGVLSLLSMPGLARVQAVRQVHARTPLGSVPNLPLEVLCTLFWMMRLTRSPQGSKTHIYGVWSRRCWEITSAGLCVSVRRWAVWAGCVAGSPTHPREGGQGWGQGTPGPSQPLSPGTAGVIASLSRILTKLLLPDELASTLIFFLVSAGLELLCFLLHLGVRRSRFVLYHTAAQPRDGLRRSPAGYSVHHDVAAGDVHLVRSGWEPWCSLLVLAAPAAAPPDPRSQRALGSLSPAGGPGSWALSAGGRAAQPQRNRAGEADLSAPEGPVSEEGQNVLADSDPAGHPGCPLGTPVSQKPQSPQSPETWGGPEGDALQQGPQWKLGHP